MAGHAQLSLTGGQVTERLLARIDIERYQSSLRRCRNFVVRAQGGADYRPGTRLVRACKTSSTVSRLVPFAFSADQGYVLEFGDQIIRFHTLGQTVLDPATGLPLEVVSPYVAADLRGLDYVQSGDILTLTHPRYPMHQLRRTGATTWQLVVVANAPTIPAPTNLVLAQGVTAAVDSLEWEWVVTAVNANGEESVASNVLSQNVKLDVVNRVDKAKLSWNAVTGAAYYNVYRGRNGVRGFIGQAKDRTTFFDDNFAPVYSETAPSGDDPFVAAGTYPSCCTYYEQRLFLSGSDAAPMSVYGSESSIFNSFRRASPPRESDAILFQVRQDRVDRVRWLIGLDQGLIIGTAGAIVRARGEGENGIITAFSVAQKPLSTSGARALKPLHIQEAKYLYLENEGGAVREGAFDQFDGYRGIDLSVMAQDLLDHHEIVAWSYQRWPYSVVWSVRDDGVLLGLTYMPEHQVWGWHVHTTDGLFEDVVTVSEAGLSRTYVIVARQVGGATVRFVERIADADPLDPRDALHLDCALTYDGRVTDGTTATLSGSAWTQDALITIAASTPQFDASMVSEQVHLPYDDAGTARVLRATIEAVNSSTQVTARLDSAAPAALQNATVSIWSIARRSFTGIGHLEGRTLGVAADGNDHAAVVVASGGFRLNYHASVVHAGLAYVGRLESLEVTELAERKTIPHVSVVVHATRGVFAGERIADQLDEYAPRAFEGYDEASAAITGVFDVAISSVAQRSAGIALEARKPLPCRVLGWIAEVVSGQR